MVHLALNVGIVLAQEDSEPSGGFGSLFFFIIIGAAVWFLFAGPQRRKMKAMRQKQQDLRESLEFGDDIVTVGGIFGRVTGTTDHDVTIDIGGGIEMRIARRAVAERVGDEPDDDSGPIR